MSPDAFDRIKASLGRIVEGVTTADPTRETILEGGQRLEALPTVDLETLARLVRENPEWIRVLGLAVGLSQEQLQVNLHQWLGTRSYRIAAKQPDAVVKALDRR